jgi:hypothetical protein
VGWNVTLLLLLLLLCNPLTRSASQLFTIRTPSKKTKKKELYSQRLLRTKSVFLNFYSFSTVETEFSTMYTKCKSFNAFSAHTAFYQIGGAN